MKFLEPLRSLPSVFKLYQNPWAYYFAKLSFVSRNGTVVIKLRNGLKFKIHTGNSDINNITEIFATPAYTKFLNSVSMLSNIVDVGANIGLFSIAAASRLTQGKVFSFEPNPYILPLLKENIALNNLASRIQIYPLGVAKHKGLFEMNFAPGDWGGASLFKDELTSAKSQEFKIDRLSLSDIFSLTKLESIHLLKIDAEGAELEILKGAKTPDFKKIRSIFVEYHEPRVSPNDLSKILTQNGFTVEKLPSPPPCLYAYRPKT